MNTNTCTTQETLLLEHGVAEDSSRFDTSLRSTDTGGGSVSSAGTIVFSSPSGQAGTIMIGADLPDFRSTDAFVLEIVEQFKRQRICSPPQTNALLITLSGGLTASGFARRWRELTGKDKTLAFYLSRMERAEVTRARASGRIETASLPPPARQLKRPL